MEKEAVIKMMLDAFEKSNNKDALTAGMDPSSLVKYIEQTRPIIEKHITNVYETLVENKIIS